MADKTARQEAKKNESVKELLDRLMKLPQQQEQQAPANTGESNFDVLDFITKQLPPEALKPIAHMFAGGIESVPGQVSSAVQEAQKYPQSLLDQATKFSQNPGAYMQALGGTALQGALGGAVGGAMQGQQYGPPKPNWGGPYDYMPEQQQPEPSIMEYQPSRDNAPMPNGVLGPLGSYDNLPQLQPGQEAQYGTSYPDNYKSYLQENQVKDSIGNRLKFGYDQAPTEKLWGTRTI